MIINGNFLLCVASARQVLVASAVYERAQTKHCLAFGLATSKRGRDCKRALFEFHEHV